MSLFPRFFANEFAPMFRLMDDYANHALAASRNGSLTPAFSNSLRTFQPRFDVKETENNYELHGELPGVDQKNINIEFTDQQTLSIKGRTEQVREEGERPTAAIEGQQAEQGRITENTESGTSTPNYHKPSVEDENTMSGANPDASKTAEASTEGTSTEVAQAQPQEVQPKSDGSRYWVSERSVGEFARSWTFPTRVDQENVKASLKNGILSIVVPKAQAPTSRRINIE